MIQKAVPVALHPDGAPLRIPAFEHPTAGLQLIKGTVNKGERPEHAAARELIEESGLETRAALMLGTSDTIAEGQMWHFALCRVVPPARDRWQHFCRDDGGHLFKFFWLSLQEPMPDGFDPLFHRAAAWMVDHFR